MPFIDYTAANYSIECPEHPYDIKMNVQVSLLKPRLFVRFFLAVLLFAVPAAATLFISRPSSYMSSNIYQTGINIYVNSGNTSTRMDLDEYLIGVVAASMPSDYHEEALKAQAVIARTNIMNILGSRRSIDDYQLNQPYIAPSALKKQLGDQWQAAADRISLAVLSTSDHIIVYDGVPISALFFKCSGGKTRSAEEVFGSDIPYLISVDSSWDSQSPDFTDETVIDTDTLMRLMQSYDSNFFAAPSGLTETIQIISRDSAGYVQTIQIGNLSLSGDDLRSLLCLPSSCFTVDADETSVTFTTSGIGHGVGLSQYGANVLAEEGKSYKEILAVYFPNTTLSSMNDTAAETDTA